MIDRAIEKYLARWAEPEAALAHEIDATYEEVVVIPARRERSSLATELTAWAPPSGRALVILVENESSEIRRPGSNPQPSPRGEWFRGDSADILRIDRASEARRLAARQGVGKARKIGGDIALALAARGRIASPWIHMTDADARLDSARFRIARQISTDVPGAAAICFAYRHETRDATIRDAMLRYEIYLREYVAGLDSAHSPYAFPSIGSVIAVRSDAYARVRGVPDREAGEDFHFLDKVAKTGAIVVDGGNPVVIEARLSDRVPFGTGPAIARIRDDLAKGVEPLVLAPSCYEDLRAWIEAMNELSIRGNLEGWAAWLEASGEAETARALGAKDAFAHLVARHPPGPRLWHHLHTWFDGLHTLRYLHARRDASHPSVPWNVALEATAGAGATDAEEALERLRARDDVRRLRGLPVQRAHSRPTVSAGS